MSLSTYSDLSNAISTWTGRGDFTAAYISNFVALFEAWANRNLRTRQMETSTTLTPSSGSAALPSDYLQWRRVTWAGDPTSELEYAHPSILQGLYPSSSSFIPHLFTIEGSNIETRSTDATNLTLEYWQKISSLETSSTNWLMSAHPDLYLYGTLLEAYLFNQDQDNAIVWKQRRDDLAAEIRYLDKSTIGPSAVRVFGQTP